MEITRIVITVFLVALPLVAAISVAYQLIRRSRALKNRGPAGKAGDQG